MEYAKSQIANLIKLAKSDGKLTHREVMLVYGIAHTAKLSKFELDEVIDHPDRFAGTMPFSEDEKITYFYRLLIMATMDMDVSEEEKELLKAMGAKIGLPADKVEKAIVYADENEVTDLNEAQFKEIMK